MLELDEIQGILSNPAALTAMIAIKRQEEKARIGSDLSNKPISDFKVFKSIQGNKDLREKFVSMLDIYIFNDCDIISLDSVAASLSIIRNSLLFVNEKF
jgi:hypothetical protein